jgi:calcineurin-like phosphoesterase
MDKEEPIRRFTRKTPGSRFEPADGPATLCGLFVETSGDGLAKRVAPVRIGGGLAQAIPEGAGALLSSAVR